ncbi:uncharacterized protein LOC144446691 [Glandiceps talaboti]
MESPTVDKEKLCTIVRETVDKSREIIENARATNQKSVDQFMETGFPKYLGPIIGLYATAFTKLNCSSSDEFRNLFQSFFKHVDIQDLYEEVVENESDWDDILKSADTKISDRFGSQLNVGSKAPIDVKVTDVRASRDITLKDFIGEENLVLVFLRHSA